MRLAYIRIVAARTFIIIIRIFIYIFFLYSVTLWMNPLIAFFTFNPILFHVVQFKAYYAVLHLIISFRFLLLLARFLPTHLTIKFPLKNHISNILKTPFLFIVTPQIIITIYAFLALFTNIPSSSFKPIILFIHAFFMSCSITNFTSSIFIPFHLIPTLSAIRTFFTLNFISNLIPYKTLIHHKFALTFLAHRFTSLYLLLILNKLKNITFILFLEISAKPPNYLSA